MNAKLCKLLRKRAGEATVGMAQRRLMGGQHGASINDPRTTRGIYRVMKGAAR